MTHQILCYIVYTTEQSKALTRFNNPEDIPHNKGHLKSHIWYLFSNTAVHKHIIFLPPVVLLCLWLASVCCLWHTGKLPPSFGLYVPLKQLLHFFSFVMLAENNIGLYSFLFYSFVELLFILFSFFTCSIEALGFAKPIRGRAGVNLRRIRVGEEKTLHWLLE